MAGTAVRGRLTWQTATVSTVTDETPAVRTLALSVPDWAGHRAGQHLDIRLTGDDGYQAERSYSIASAPGEPVAITVERLDDGEVSPYLTQDVQVGDEMEIRGPIGGYFVWDGVASDSVPLLLAAGGSGVVPLRAILRHRSQIGSSVPVRLLYSVRSLADVIYRAEFSSLSSSSSSADGVQVIYTLTRQQPPGWTGYARRVDQQMMSEVAWPVPVASVAPVAPAGSAAPVASGVPVASGAALADAGAPLAYVCGPTNFVEAVAADLVALGYPPQRVKTERFGATGTP
jgi:ferredoxin-NADP reductase